MMWSSADVPHSDGDWIYSILIFYIYSAFVQTMPVPLPGQRWYTWFYSFMQVLGANIQNVFHSKDAALVTTTSIRKNGKETVVQKVEEVKVPENNKKE